MAANGLETLGAISNAESAIVHLLRDSSSPIEWSTAKEEFITRLGEILTHWNLPDRQYTEKIASFPAPPHTVQRLAELLDDPPRWYSDPAKFGRALSRVLSVTSTTLDYSEEIDSQAMTHEDSLLVPIPWLRDDMDTTVPPVTASLSGSAPMDMTDYGPQSDAVQETIAHNANAAANEVGTRVE